MVAFRREKLTYKRYDQQKIGRGMAQPAAEKKLNVLFVCERGHAPLEYIRAFAERGHRFTMYTDADRAMMEFRQKPFKFDLVVVDLPLKSNEAA
jgi:hypothetical protein